VAAERRVVREYEVQESFEVVRLGDSGAGFFEQGLQVLLHRLLTVETHQIM
jgi:hypothetical protein